MLTLTGIRAYMGAQPFRPFRLHMASGKTFDIRHPEMIKLGKNFLVIFSVAAGETDVFERFDSVSMMLIESVSHIDQPVSA